MIKFNLKSYVLSKTFYLQIEQSKYIFNFNKNSFFILEKNDFSIRNSAELYHCRCVHCNSGGVPS